MNPGGTGIPIRFISAKLDDDNNTNALACINYYYKNYLLGKIHVELAIDKPEIFDFSTQKMNTLNIIKSNSQNTIFINVIHLLIGFIFLTIFTYLLFSIQSFARNKKIAKRRKKKLKRTIHHGNHWDIHKF